MEKVLGIGGLFFRSRDPQSLAAWYATHLGVSPVPANYDDPPWEQQPGPTAFAPFPGNTRYFGDPASPQPLQWMVNFRVANLEAFLSQLRAAGIEVTLDPETYPNGRFARLHDPEGNPIELWQPANRDA
jgi:glyoxylase I family protein